MKDFPEIYKDDVIEEMYAKLNMSDDKIKLLKQYFEVFSNLYGIIEMSKAYEIIDSQNPNMFTEDEFIAFTEVCRHERKYYDILSMDELYEYEEESKPLDRLLVKEWLLQYNDDFDNVYDMQQDVDYYVPDKDILLRYTDESYYEPNVQTEKMLGFMKNDLGLSLSEAQNHLIDAIGMIGVSIGEIKPTFGVMPRTDRFTEEQWDRYDKLYCELADNVRLCENRGHTNAEVGRHYLSFTKPEIFDDYPPIHPQNTPRKSTKISPNAPCPCGSGKKYKKCCALS